MDGEFEATLNSLNRISLADKRSFTVCGIMNTIFLRKAAVILSIRQDSVIS